MFPNLGDGGQLGRGARLTYAGLEQIAPDTPRSVVHVDFAPDADAAREVAGLRRALDVYPIFDDQRPDALVNFGDDTAFPIVVGTTVALVAIATLLHTLVSSIRRRRTDLAVLKTIGLARRQVAGIVAVQSTVLVAVALLIGLPVGVAVGRITWMLVADRIGVPAEPVIAAAPLAGIALAVIGIANLVAIVPAWVAGRTPPARILRTE